MFPKTHILGVASSCWSFAKMDTESCKVLYPQALYSIKDKQTLLVA